MHTAYFSSAERWLQGFELSVPVVGQRVSPDPLPGAAEPKGSPLAAVARRIAHGKQQSGRLCGVGQHRIDDDNVEWEGV